MSQTQSIARTTAARGAAATGGRPRLGLALLVIATAQLMVVLDATIVNVALPHVQRALGFSGSGLEWVVNAYAVTFGGLLLLGGREGGPATSEARHPRACVHLPSRPGGRLFPWVPCRRGDR